MKATYNQKPDTISYMKLPNGKADVWLRKNIAETTDEDGNTTWEADEVYFRTNLDQGSILAEFDELFLNGGETGSDEEPVGKPTVEDRLDAIEAAILELAEVMMENG